MLTLWCARPLQRQEAVIQNPTEQELVLHARSSSDAFAVDPPVLVVPPLDELVFDVLHIPSSVGKLVCTPTARCAQTSWSSLCVCAMFVRRGGAG